MDNSSLANSIFVGAPTEDLLVADVFEMKEESKKTSFISKVEDKGLDAVKFARDNPAQVRDLANMLTAMKDGSGYGSPLEKVSRLKNMLPASALSSISKFKSATGGVLEDLASKVGVSPELVGKVKTLSGEVAGSIMNGAMYGDFNKFQVLEGLVRDTSLFKYLDIESEVLMANEIFMNAIGTDMFTTLIDKLEERFDKDVYSYGLSYAAPEIVYSGDLDSMIAVINKIGLEAFMRNVSNPVKDVLTSYKMKTYNPATFPQEFSKLVNTLRLVNPNFPNHISENRIDLDVAANISSDAVTLFVNNEDIRFTVLAIHGPNFPEANKNELFTMMYPDAAIGATV